MTFKLGKIQFTKTHVVGDMRLVLTAVLCCGTGVAISLCADQLDSVNPHVDIDLPVEKQVSAVDFNFKNVSQFSAKIVEVRTECDCIQTSIPTYAIEAGKIGVVTLKFRSKLRNGTELVRAKVVTDSGETHEISVSAKLRSYIEVRPLALHWMKGEKRDTRVFIVSSTGLAKLQFTKVAAVKSSRVEIQRGEDPATIRVQVTPPESDALFTDILVVSAVVDGTNETKLYDLPVSAD